MKSPVILTLLVFSLLSVLVSSCSKGSDKPKDNEPPITDISVPGIYYKLDGVENTHTERDTSYVWKSPYELADEYMVNFRARNQKRSIVLSLSSDKNDFKVGTYKFGIIDAPIAYIEYYPDITKDLGSYYARPYSYETPGDVTITITEYTNDYAKGTFSGSVYLNSNIAWNGEKKKAVITDGRFYCRFKK